MTRLGASLDDTTLRRLVHILGAVAVSGLATVVWLDAYRPLATRRAELGAEAAHLDDLWKDRAGLEAARARQAAAREAAARELDLWRGRVPAAAAEGELLAQLSDAAARLDIELEEFRVDGAGTVAGCPALEAHTSFRAGYPDLCRFLDRIERLPRLCRVSRFHLDADGAADGRHRVSLTLHAFFRPPADPSRS